MKTIPLEQISSMPMLLLFELLTALVILTVGILILHKTVQNPKKKVIAGALVGVVAGIAMIGVMLGVNAHVEATNNTLLRAAVTEAGEKLTDDQITELETAGAVNLDDDRTISFLNDGTDSSITVYDASEYAKIQKEEDIKRDKQMRENDY